METKYRQNKDLPVWQKALLLGIAIAVILIMFYLVIQTAVTYGLGIK